MIALTLAHLRLVLVSLSLAYVLGVGIGVFASLRPTLGRALVLFSSLIQTVPAIAFLAGMVPLLAWVAARTGAPIPAIGELPALADTLASVPDQQSDEIGGSWRDWGNFRAVVHRVVHELLAAS